MTSPGGLRASHRRHRGRATAAAAALGLAVIVVALVVVRSGWPSPPDHATTAAPASSAQATGSAAAGAAPQPTGRHDPPGSPWLRVLAAIDGRRETAWRSGRPAGLRHVFVDGSVELADDQRMLRGYTARGLRVDGVAMTFTAVRVQSRRPDRVGLLVIDRLGPAVARDRAGHTQPLPRDLPTRHRIVLERVDGQWLIARITLA